MKFLYHSIFILVFIPVFIACKGHGDEVLNSDNGLNSQDYYSLETCETNIGPGVPNFYSKYFKCVTINMSESGNYVNIYFNGLAPYDSWYYEQGNPNQIPYESQGQGYFQIPGAFIQEMDYVMSIPVNPVPRSQSNDWIDGQQVNGEVDGGVEYPMGSAGAALNGVNMFNPCASPPDIIEDEAYTFDLYSGHPAGSSGIYHYHTTSAGPLEVLASEGLTNSTIPGQGDIEMYGMMCDGVLVLGCTELDGMPVNSMNWDAQNGHKHDIVDEAGIVHFYDRYHTHICYDELTENDTDGNGFQEHEFTPEVSYYTFPGQSETYVCNVGNQPLEPDSQLGFNDDVLPITAGLKTSYPNPFNPLVTIDYSVKNFDKITLSIVDLNGNIIQTLISDKMAPSDYSIVWDASTFPSGVYFIQYKSADIIENQKITLIK
mgnify:CR=1 FL=1